MRALGRLVLLGLVLAAATAPAVDARTYPWLGVRIRDLSEQEMEDISAKHGIREGFGVYIVDVIEGAPAQRAGLKRGDIVVAVNDRPIVETRLLQRLLASASLEKDVRLTILRPEGRRHLGVRLAMMPAPMAGERTAADFGFVLREPLASGQPGGRAMDPNPPGVAAIAAVLKGSPAERAGLTVGDVLVEVAGRAVDTGEAAREALAGVDVSGPLRLTIRRNGEQRGLTVAAP
jgi:serine protease Do